jgi:membrane-associated phospholipid phosphatase
MHIPREPLADLGFTLLPALTPEHQVISEILFFGLFGSTILFMVVWPWFDISKRHQPITKRLHVVIMLARALGVCAFAQTLRIVCFLVTSLPGPNYHCRPNSKAYDPPRGLYDIFVRQDPFTHCGDLVFSSHTIFVMLCVLIWRKYGGWQPIYYYVLYIFVAIFGCAVVAARKHYTLDVVVAMYTVPLLWIAYDQQFPDKYPPELMSNEQFVAEEIQQLSLSSSSSSCDGAPEGLPMEVRVDDDIEMQLN